MKIKRVLVPIDFSEESLQALDYAIDIGEGFEPEFVVLHALEQLQFAEMGHMYGAGAQTLIDEQRRAARTELTALGERLKKRPVRCRTVLLQGTTYRAIVDAAKRLKADLIVMGTHGRTGMSRLLLGSVAELVVRHAECPVLTVRPRRRRKKQSSARGKKRS
jgi:nucleotide-binding universal stress UspA family protein